MVPFWIPIIIRHLICRVLKEGTIILTTTRMTWGRDRGPNWVAAKGLGMSYHNQALCTACPLCGKILSSA